MKNELKGVQVNRQHFLSINLEDLIRLSFQAGFRSGIYILNQEILCESLVFYSLLILGRGDC